MPLCHWPCSCYPNHYTGQIHDWMSELYPRWVAAHGEVIESDGKAKLRAVLDAAGFSIA